jgi:hypothetical protein
LKYAFSSSLLAGGRFFLLRGRRYADRRCGRAGRIFLRFTRKNQQESSETFMKSLNFDMPRGGFPVMTAYVCSK